MTHDPSSPSKLLVPESNIRNLEAIDHVQVSGTRMHDTLSKLLVRDSGTSDLDGELGSCDMGLSSGNQVNTVQRDGLIIANQST